MADLTNVSAEVEAMQLAERKKWLTVAEGQRVRKEWESLRKAMDEMVGKFDENPEDDKEALLLIVLAGLICSGFVSKAVDAATKLKELNGA